MESFKLLAIRPLENCSHSLLKILKPGEFYFFDQNYLPNKQADFIERVESAGEYLPEDFFIKKVDNGSSLEHVNIQALVGKNGEGKSSLTDLALRIFNNYFKADKAHDVTRKLLFVRGLFAQLYFSIGKEVYRITVSGNEKETPTGVLEVRGANGVPKQVSLSNNQRLFVMNVNYSHYSLNINDFRHENFVNNKNKELHPWLDRIFHRNDGYQTPITVHPFRNHGNIDINNEKALSNQRLINLILTEKSYAEISSGLKVFGFTFEKFDNDPVFNALNRICHNSEQVFQEKHDGMKLIKELLSDLDHGNLYFMNLLVIFIDTYVPMTYRGVPPEELQNGRNTKFFPKDKQKKIVSFFGWLNKFGKDELIKLWVLSTFVFQKFIGVEKMGQLPQLLVQYLSVKAAKILRYPQYESVNFRSEKSTRVKALGRYLQRLENDPSHVSLKYNQARRLLDLVLGIPDCDLVTFYKGLVTGDINSKTLEREKFGKLVIDAQERLKVRPDSFYLNPPGIFRTSLELSANSGNEKIPLGSISSGQFQKVGLISSVIYHLKNIDSIKFGDFGNVNCYDKVLLILDEIELYFHPDFQRTFVNELLTKISSVKFKQLKSINILFVTHSPFILSDIPRVNVLFLEKGLQVHPMTENTFGANIHTLLQHGFFLKGVPIGEFARNKINELFTMLTNEDVAQVKDIEKRILMVSEPFLRSQLLKLYSERKTSVNMLMKRIEELENRLNDSNR